MEAKWGEALNDGRRIVVNLKRKKAARYAARVAGASRALLSQRPCSNLPFNRFGNRKKSSRCKKSYGLHLRRLLLKNYTNFSKSGLPRRVLYYQHGEWLDYPQNIVELVREQFHVKNAAIKVEFDGTQLFLDALYMIQLDYKTDLCKHIAWVDEGGRCFFPEFFLSNGELHECFQSELGNDRTSTILGPNGSHEIKLQLEIDIIGANSSELEDCVEESNIHTKGAKIEQKSASNGKDVEVNDNCNADGKMQKATEKIQKIEEYVTAKIEPVHEIACHDTVRDMFVMGMSSYASPDILEIRPCSSHLMQTRLELFQKQVEIIRKNRGNPNIKNAWLAATKNAVSSIMKYGIGLGGPIIMDTYGTGVHLTSINCAHLSASYCDDDENGVKYIVFCRVILGNVEVVNPGSKQCHPSTENFDSGVDDLQNPFHYIVWNMNMNTHIFPEYVVSFKMRTSAKGALVRKESRSGVATSQGPQCQLQIQCPQIAPGRPVNLGSSLLKTPNSPWMPFPLLFEALSKDVGPKNMEAVNMHYDLYRLKKICRDDFIKRLRFIVGDDLLRSTITSLRNKLP